MLSNSIVVFCNIILEHKFLAMAIMEPRLQQYVWTCFLYVYNGTYGHGLLFIT